MHATCVPVALEVMHRTEKSSQYADLFSALLGRSCGFPSTRARAGERSSCNESWRRSLTATTGGLQSDYLIAATAERAGDDIALWFFDQDLRIICEHTGQPFEAEASTGAGH